MSTMRGAGLLLFISGTVAAWAPALPAEEATMTLKVAAKLAAGRALVKIVGFGDSITGVYYHTGGRRARTTCPAGS